MEILETKISTKKNLGKHHVKAGLVKCNTGHQKIRIDGKKVKH